MRFKIASIFLLAILLPLPGSGQSTLKSAMFPFDSLKEQKEENATFRPILDGLVHSGIRIDVHEVFLLPGSLPHHMHHHSMDELFLVSEGEVEMTIAGKKTRLGPGSAAFAASGDEHQIQNLGTRPAQYFEVILGGSAPHN
jgi:mannose-6-phosphate isomerase-like protein (cupin superfamily)